MKIRSKDDEKKFQNEVSDKLFRTGECEVDEHLTSAGALCLYDIDICLRMNVFVHLDTFILPH